MRQGVIVHNIRLLEATRLRAFSLVFCDRAFAEELGIIVTSPES